MGSRKEKKLSVIDDVLIISFKVKLLKVLDRHPDLLSEVKAA